MQVWAGWGHASENPKLPELLLKVGIAFIGPPDKAMWALGDKIASSIVAQTAGVPTIPWTGTGLKVKWNEGDLGKPGKVVTVPRSVYEEATVKSVEEGLQAVAKIGLPVMIKASEGGGGKGIRKCTTLDNFDTQFRQVCLLHSICTI